MNITRKRIAGVSFLLSLTGWGAQAEETKLKIEIHLCNYSAVSAESMALAEQETTGIFERIGVTTAWVVCSLPPQEPVRASGPADAAPELVLRLLSSSMADKLRVGSDTLGRAHLPNNVRFGVWADVFADRTRGLGHGKEFEVILGLVIAHELGHLLLGKHTHSVSGLMQARLGSEEVKWGRQVLTFLPEEAKSIRAGVMDRMRGEVNTIHSQVRPSKRRVMPEMCVE